jgi:hypothetical protein
MSPALRKTSSRHRPALHRASPTLCGLIRRIARVGAPHLLSTAILVGCAALLSAQTSRAQESCSYTLALNNASRAPVSVQLRSVEVSHYTNTPLQGGGLLDLHWGPWRSIQSSGWLSGQRSATLQPGGTVSAPHLDTAPCAYPRKFKAVYSCVSGPRSAQGGALPPTHTETILHNGEWRGAQRVVSLRLSRC